MSTRSSIYLSDDNSWHLYHELSLPDCPLMLEIEQRAFTFTGRVPDVLAKAIEGCAFNFRDRPYGDWENDQHTIAMLSGILEREKLCFSPGECYAIERALRIIRKRKHEKD